MDREYGELSRNPLIVGKIHIVLLDLVLGQISVEY